MRYAAPSVPPLRFAAAQPPIAQTGIQDATKEGPICVSANNPEGLQFDSPRQFMAEDCLFVAVYAPANATELSNLPVMLFISGGGFTSNSNANFNGTKLVEASGMNMIVVRANYRVGILGFIAGTLIDADTKGATSNNGLKDMVAAARWIKQFIPKFGGNPNHIVINGDSSGGNAIDELLAANNGTGFPDLFVGAIAESTGWGAEGFSADRDNAVTNNLKATGCDTKPDPIDCLRNLPIGELQARSTRDGFGPTVDGSFIVAPHFQMFEQGRFQNIPVIYGYASDEATPDFISNQTVNTTDELGADIKKKVGGSMTDAELATVLAAYPDTLNNVSIFGRDMSVHNASLRQGSGLEWQRDAAIKTELNLHCVGAFFADMYAARGQAATFAYRYNILDSTPGGNADKGLFSPHTSELYAVWGANNTDGGDPGCLKLPATDPLSCAAGASIAQSYWISFIRTLDPNALRAAGAPAWTPWSVTAPNRILLDNAGASMEQMGSAVGEVPLAGMNQRQRCLSLTLPLSKRINQGLGANQTLPPFANGTAVDPTAVVLQNIMPIVAPPPVAPAVVPAAAPAPVAPASVPTENAGNGSPSLNTTTPTTASSSGSGGVAAVPVAAGGSGASMASSVTLGAISNSTSALNMSTTTPSTGGAAGLAPWGISMSAVLFGILITVM